MYWVLRKINAAYRRSVTNKLKCFRIADCDTDHCLVLQMFGTDRKIRSKETKRDGNQEIRLV
jgi:hypothetical protein